MEKKNLPPQMPARAQVLEILKKDLHYLPTWSSVGSMTDDLDQTIDLDLVAAEVRRRGISAHVEQTGGGCATLFAGTPWEADGEARYPCAAGAGTYGYGEAPSVAYVGDFYVGPDTLDVPHGPDAYVEVKTTDVGEIASLILRTVSRYTR